MVVAVVADAADAVALVAMQTVAAGSCVLYSAAMAAVAVSGIGSGQKPDSGNERIFISIH